MKHNMNVGGECGGGDFTQTFFFMCVGGILIASGTGDLYKLIQNTKHRGEKHAILVCLLSACEIYWGAKLWEWFLVSRVMICFGMDPPQSGGTHG